MPTTTPQIMPPNAVGYTVAGARPAVRPIDGASLLPARAMLTATRVRTVLAALLLATAAVFVLCLPFGATPVDMRTALRVLLLWATGNAAEASDLGTAGVILWQIRLPRILMGCVVGGGLAAVGVALQALLRNALADPYILGVSSGAALGAALAMLFGIGTTLLGLPALPCFGFLGSLCTLWVMRRLAQAHRRLPIHSLLLVGVILNAILTALIMFITSIMDPNRSAGLMAWLMGSLSAPESSVLVAVVLVAVLGIAILMRDAPVLNLLTMGDETAQSLGLETERAKRRIVWVTAVLTGAVVSVSGMIGFIGMIVPHAVRLLVGSDHRLLLPASALVGGMFLMVADTVARTAWAPMEIPVGIVTALTGGPFFLFLLLRRKDRMV